MVALPSEMRDEPVRDEPVQKAFSVLLSYRCKKRFLATASIVLLPQSGSISLAGLLKDESTLTSQLQKP
jgi:hypothetical protein